MNKISLHFLMAGLLLFSLASCKKDSKSSVNSIIQDGKWRVTLFSSNGNDETSHYSGYQFSFDNNGSVSAINGSSTVSGTYSDGNDDSQTKLVLNFSSHPTFSELNSDWAIIEKTTSLLRLEDVSGGNGGTDLLTLEKL